MFILNLFKFSITKIISIPSPRRRLNQFTIVCSISKLKAFISYEHMLNCNQTQWLEAYAFSTGNSSLSYCPVIYKLCDLGKTFYLSEPQASHHQSNVGPYPHNLSKVFRAETKQSQDMNRST